MESRFGHDFSQVRVHADAQARESAKLVHAQAYTVGDHVVMGADHQPYDHRTRHLLAHELTHVLQQQHQPSGRLSALGVSDPGDPAETEAERIARATGTSEQAHPVVQLDAGPSLQRSCGPAQISSVTGCVGRGGVIAAFGASSEDVFQFRTDCDEFFPGEEERLADYATRIRPGDWVQIDGFASEEGPADFNENLSCARAHAAAAVLAAAGVIPQRVEEYMHGGTPGDRPMHRSVVITATPGQESRRPSATVFHPGVMHDHKPTGRWADVQADPNSGFFENRACGNLPPSGVVGVAIEWEFGDKRTALEHLNWYLGNGGGADFDENANLAAMLRTETVLHNRIKAHIPIGRSSGTTAFHFPFFQSDYDSQDLRFSFGAIDRLDFEIDFVAGTVHAWFQDRYEWHPVYPFYSKFPDDRVRSTNCVHAALVELKSGGARDYWMKGEATVPLNVFRSEP
jgi:outer membrane protein OmpA-like peptidoglycan-associated protein